MIIQYISLETNDGTAVNIDDVEIDGTILCQTMKQHYFMKKINFIF